MKKYKLSKTRKTLIALGLCVAMTIGGGLKIMSNFEPHANGNTTQTNNSVDEQGEQATYVDSNPESEYINVVMSDEKKEKSQSLIDVKIDFSVSDYKSILEKLNDFETNFTFSEYYDLENTLKVYSETILNSRGTTDLLTNGKIDSNKLYNKVIKNNEKLLAQDVNSITTFYSKADSTMLIKICNIISDEINSNKEKYDIELICNVLNELTIFEKPSMIANAQVTDSLTFLYSNTSIERYKNMQKIRGNTYSDDEILKLVFEHEIRHLIQFKSSDLNKKNGLEMGPFRMYNVSKSEVNTNVDSLWYKWILEAAAEIDMAETLGIEPTTYEKKISYVYSYSLSRIFDKDYNTKDFKEIAYENNLDEMFNSLNINDEDSKMDFLKFMYSVQLIEYGNVGNTCDDFWKFYGKNTGKVLTKEEKTDVLMQTRADIIMYLTKNYYTGLIKAINDGTVKDLETVFYFMRMWEIDSYSHLEYTKENSIDFAKTNILYQEEVQNLILTAIANSNKITTDTLRELYNNYFIKNSNSNSSKNCVLVNFDAEKETFLDECFDGYNIGRYSRIYTMRDYIEQLGINQVK